MAATATEEPEPEGVESPEGVEAPEAEEQVAVQVPNPRAWFEGQEEDAFWEETFGSWTDSKPKGMINYTSALKSMLMLCHLQRPRIPFPRHQLP